MVKLWQKTGTTYLLVHRLSTFVTYHAAMNRPGRLKRGWCFLTRMGFFMSSRTTVNLACAASLLIPLAGSANEPVPLTIRADVWVDNWFALYAGDELVKEDSVPFDTERSFNSESFTFETDPSAVLSILIKDYIENDTGLEYIGSRRQMSGDGGFIAQFVDTETNSPVAISDESWRCLAIHQAPINRICERSSNPEQDCEAIIQPEPDNWKEADFDDSAWPEAVVRTRQEVRPMGGFNQVTWNSEARLIWTADLETDNTVLCRFTISAPE